MPAATIPTSRPEVVAYVAAVSTSQGATKDQYVTVSALMTRYAIDGDEVNHYLAATRTGR